MNKNDFPYHELKTNLYKNLECSIEFKSVNKQTNIDGVLQIAFEGIKPWAFQYIIINKNTNPTFERLYGMYLLNNNIVFISDNLRETVKKSLKENGISYIELNGNCFIKTEKNIIYIATNNKTISKKILPNRAFTKTGLKIILYYLMEEENINMPSRDLASHLGIGFSNFHYVNQGLKKLKYLIPKDKNLLVLNNRKELLDRWIFNYEEKIKPMLLVGRYRFSNAENLKDWRNLKTDVNFQWGGEAAAAILTNNLEPKIFSIYTSETTSVLIKKYKIIPDKEGYIFVYKPFYFLFAQHYLNATNPIITYADLIISNESRNVEAAKKIYEKYIQY